MIRDNRFFRTLASLAIILTIAGCVSKETPEENPPKDDTDNPTTTEPSDTTETPTEEPDEPPFILKVYDITSVMATVEVEPSDKRSPYYMDIISDPDFQETVKYGFDDYMKWFIEHMKEQTGKDTEDIIELISSYGNDGFIVTTLKPETKYHAVAVGIGEDGMTTTDVISQEFTTLARTVSDNTFKIDVSDITSSTALIRTTTANDDPYILTIEPYSTTSDIEDKDLAEHIIQNNMAWGGLDQMTYKGNSEVEHLGKAGWEYEVIAFGYEDGAPTTDITRVRFTMEEGNDTKTCNFTFSHTFDTFNMSLSVTPSDTTVVYVTNIISEDELKALMSEGISEQDALKKNLESLIEELLQDCGTRANVVELISFMSSTTYQMKFTPATKYIQWAVPVDQDGYPTAEFSVSDTFTSPEETVSNAGLTLKKYIVYNGTDLADLYPEKYKFAKDYAVVDMTVEANEDAVTWWSYIAMEDLTNRSKETIIKNLMQAPTEPNLTRQIILAFWGTNTIMGVAQDKDGIYGELLLEVVNLDKSKVADAKDIIL